VLSNWQQLPALFQPTEWERITAFRSLTYSLASGRITSRAYDATASLKPVIIALNPGQGVFVIQERVFARGFMALHRIADAR
jgi:hypothetical protein